MAFRLVAKDIAIDLGSANIKVFQKEEGVVLNEPSVIVMDHTSSDILAVGSAAKDMIGKTPDKLIAVSPLAGGVVSDFNLTEALLNYFYQKINPGFSLLQSKVVISLPSGIREIEAKAVEEAALHAGARDVILVDESMAANFGMGLSPEDPRGILTINIGASTSEVSLISMNGIVSKKSLKKAGSYIDENIVRYFKENKGLEIGINTAENVKISLMSLKLKDADNSMVVEGRDVESAKPESVEVVSSDLVDCILPFLDEILEMVYEVMEKIPPELSSDVKRDGFVLTGGMASLQGLREFLENKINLIATVSENPSMDAINGCGVILENPDRFLKYKK